MFERNWLCGGSATRANIKFPTFLSAPSRFQIEVYDDCRVGISGWEEFDTLTSRIHRKRLQEVAPKQFAAWYRLLLVGCVLDRTAWAEEVQLHASIGTSQLSMALTCEFRPLSTAIDPGSPRSTRVRDNASATLWTVSELSANSTTPSRVNLYYRELRSAADRQVRAAVCWLRPASPGLFLCAA